MVDLTRAYPGGFTAKKQKPSAYIDRVDPFHAFLDHLRDRGFNPPQFFAHGEIVRIDAPGDKPNKKSGWAVYSEVDDHLSQGVKIGVGCFGSWREGPEKEVWTSKRVDAMSTDERVDFNSRLDAVRRQREKEQKQVWAEAAERAQSIWANLPAASEHPYTDKKRVKPHGLRLKDDALCVPVYDASGTIVSLQYIWPDKKRFMSGGQTRGCFYVIPGADDVVYVCEGYATGASIFEATGATVYIAFNAGNLCDVTQAARANHAKARLIVAGDDDTQTSGNPGRAKACQAADLVGCEVVFPPMPTDFNDAACAGHDVAQHLKPVEHKKKQDTNYRDMPPDLLSPPGMLGEVAAYYNATARKPQPGFAVQTALALASVVCGRSYRSDKENFTALYFLNVAKSTTGKEHAKNVCEKILEAAGAFDLVIGGGYTSSGAVFSALMRKPRHIAVIDEFGLYMEAANSQKNTNLMEANKELMQMIGRTHGIAQPMAYSTMTLPKDRADEMSTRRVYNPSITMLCMTTPSELYNNLSIRNVKSGFLGRFIIHQSSVERDVGRMRGIVEVPKRVTDWIEAIRARASVDQEIASERPEFVTIAFSPHAEQLCARFEQWCVDLCNELEKRDLEELPGRSHEMAMKIALIVALARDPYCTSIEADDARWAIDYVRFAVSQTAEIFKMKVSGSVFEAEKKEILEAIKKSGTEGVALGTMGRTPPFSKYKPKDRNEILRELCDTDLVVCVPNVAAPGKPGRPKTIYWHRDFYVDIDNSGD